MKNPLPPRWAAHLALSLVIVTLCGAAASQPAASATPARPPAQNPKPLVEQARDMLIDGKAIQALALARRAAQEAPDDYKAPYYIALALMELGEAGEAAAAAQRSLRLARTPEAQAAVQQLQGTLAAQSALKEADAAAAEGLFAKAGRIYQQAWEKGVLPPDKTIVAADLFQLHLKDVATAARMLRDLPTRYPGTPAAEAATQRLVAMRGALQGVADEALAQAAKLDVGHPERPRWLRAVLEADAGNAAALTMLANDAAELGNWAALEPQLRLLQRRGLLQGLLEGRRLSFGKWQTDARLRTLLTDIWGDKRGAELLAMNTADSQPVSAEVAGARALRTQAQHTAAFAAAGLKAGTGVAFRDCATCPEMVWIPPGALPQRPEAASSLARWFNKVRFSYPLAVGKYEITFDEWDACVAEGACKAVPEGFVAGLLIDDKWGRGRQPVINVEWNDASAYTQWLSKKTGESYRLLSLAEYTYAARAGRIDNELGVGAANCPDCGGPSARRTVVVGSFKPNAWGLHDMLGNVSEMVDGCMPNVTAQDSFPVDGSPVVTGCNERPGIEASRQFLGKDKVAMGGDWAQPLTAGGVPLVYAFERGPGLGMGFRIARTYKAK